MVMLLDIWEEIFFCFGIKIFKLEIIRFEVKEYVLCVF